MADNGLDEREGRTGVSSERDEGVTQGVESDFGAVPLLVGILHAGLDAAGLEDVPVIFRLSLFFSFAELR